MLEFCIKKTKLFKDITIFVELFYVHVLENLEKITIVVDIKKYEVIAKSFRMIYREKKTSLFIRVYYKYIQI